MLQLSDETKQGLGIMLHFLRPFFGSLIAIAQPPRPTSELHTQHTLPPVFSPQTDQILLSQSQDSSSEMSFAASPPVDADWAESPKMSLVLTDYLPKPGYFLAGGAAGMASRTATAPLDRLKVYLIAQTGNTRDTIDAAKRGAPIDVMRGAWRTASSAVKDLWAAGGIRSLYAGQYCHSAVLVIPS